MSDTVAQNAPVAPGSETLDLSSGVLNAYWATRSQQLYHVICEMERSETWPIDGSLRILDAIERLGHRLSTAAVTTLAALPHDELILVLGYISAGRALRVYQFLHERAPDTAIDVLETCRRHEGARPMPPPSSAAVLDDHGIGEAAHAHLERLRQIERTLVLSRVFGTANITPLLNALIAEPRQGRGGETS